MKIKELVLARAKERTTWVGLFILLNSAGLTVDADLKEAIIAALLSLVGLAAILLDEDKEAEKKLGLPPSSK